VENAEKSTYEFIGTAELINLLYGVVSATLRKKSQTLFHGPFIKKFSKQQWLKLLIRCYTKKILLYVLQENIGFVSNKESDKTMYYWQGSNIYESEDDYRNQNKRLYFAYTTKELKKRLTCS
jgi:hypothetical protein